MRIVIQKTFNTAPNQTEIAQTARAITAILFNHTYRTLFILLINIYALHTRKNHRQK